MAKITRIEIIPEVVKVKEPVLEEVIENTPIEKSEVALSLDGIMGLMSEAETITCKDCKLLKKTKKGKKTSYSCSVKKNVRLKDEACAHVMLDI